MWRGGRTRKALSNDGQRQQRRREHSHAIEVRQLVKVYSTPAGDFTALKGVDLQVGSGEFVAVIGKSGSGKSTFINMLTGIDRPTSGEVWIGATPVHTLGENAMAEWRGRNLGIVFQFFQLMPTLTLVENLMLPMDLNGMYRPRQRRERAMQLLERVGMADHARKLPAAVSGGQQQRVAIARALANDPPLIVADEPTGNLDSKTAEEVFRLFEELVAGGKTIVMVTHDDDLAKRVDRTIVISDGQVVNEYLVRALSALSQDLLVEVARKVEPLAYAPGASMIRQGEIGDKFFIILGGEAEVFVEQPGGAHMLVDRLKRGRYFGEMALVGNGLRTATVRAAPHAEVSVVALDRKSFDDLIGESRSFREELSHIVDAHLIKYRVQALSALSYEALLEVTRRVEVNSFAPGTTIVRQGALGETFYILVDGAVDVSVQQPDGSERVIDRLASGQYFGELALLGDRRRSATVRVSQHAPAKVVELGLDDFERLARDSELFKKHLAQLTEERRARLT